MATKFSQFTEGGDIRVGDKIVGLRSNDNAQFTFPGNGILDTNGNPLICWEGALASVNFMTYMNADTGASPTIETSGNDAMVGLDIATKGNGNLNLNLGTGKLVLNSTTGISEITNDTTLASDSSQAAPTEHAVKTYVDNLIAGISNFETVSTSSENMSENTTYYTTFAGLTTLTLPATATVGSYLRVIATSAGNTFRMAQNSGQQIHFGSQLGVAVSTTVGTGGYLESVDPNTVVHLICVSGGASTVWTVVSSIQQLTVV